MQIQCNHPLKNKKKKWKKKKKTEFFRCFIVIKNNKWKKTKGKNGIVKKVNVKCEKVNVNVKNKM